MDLAGNHFTGYSYYQFTTRAAVATGGEGNDYLTGSGKGQVLNGGAGIDTAYYDDSQGALQVSRSAGQIMVKAAGAAAGDTLTGIERLLFPTHALALDIDGNGGQAYRLYQAAFNRAPDSVGLGFWIAAMDNKTSLHTVAQGFVDSTEFKTLYGAAPSDAEFVKLLYNNVLHRAPDQAGTDFWVQGLHDGASRADILANFSESPENQGALLSVIGNGFAYTPYG
jgi:Ca2+-binding RTX toxin-like protein